MTPCSHAKTHTHIKTVLLPQTCLKMDPCAHLWALHITTSTLLDRLIAGPTALKSADKNVLCWPLTELAAALIKAAFKNWPISLSPPCMSILLCDGQLTPSYCLALPETRAGSWRAEQQPESRLRLGLDFQKGHYLPLCYVEHLFRMI